MMRCSLSSVTPKRPSGMTSSMLPSRVISSSLAMQSPCSVRGKGAGAVGRAPEKMSAVGGGFVAAPVVLCLTGSRPRVAALPRVVRAPPDQGQDGKAHQRDQPISDDQAGWHVVEHHAAAGLTE